MKKQYHHRKMNPASLLILTVLQVKFITVHQYLLSKVVFIELGNCQLPVYNTFYLDCFF